MAKDLFDVDCESSIVRSILCATPEIDLSQEQVDPYILDLDFNVVKFGLPGVEYAGEIRSKIEPIMAEAEANGCPNNFYSALYEAVLNAHEHGNLRNPDKKITLAHRLDPASLTCVVMDQGGVLVSEFVPFILRHREGRHLVAMLDFYQFSKKPKANEGNLGKGTSFIHTYADKVGYFKSEEGGLVVSLTKTW